MDVLTSSSKGEIDFSGNRPKDARALVAPVIENDGNF
jgi:hypothetical protein